MLGLTPARRTSGRAGVSRMSILPVLFACLPAILLLVATFLLPIVSTLRLSFSEWPGVGPIEWVGFKKYSELVVNPDFHSSIKVTIVFSILSTIGVMGTALLMGLAASQSKPDRPWTGWRGWGWTAAMATAIRMNCRAGSGSGWRSRGR